MTLADHRRTTPKANKPPKAPTPYAADPYTWALQQAESPRSVRLDRIDTVNLADEIAGLAPYLTDMLRSDRGRVPQHLLKWDHQPPVRSRRWAWSIKEHRRRVAEHLHDGPGLKSVLPKILDRAYAGGRGYAWRQTKLPNKALPETCPCSWDEIMSRPIDWPEEP